MVGQWRRRWIGLLVILGVAVAMGFGWGCSDNGSGVEPDAGADAMDDADVDVSCDDGTVSGDQTDIDCGGSECPPCQFAQQCEQDDDCETGVCDDEI